MAVSPYHLTSNGPRVNTIVVDLATIPTRKITMDLIVRFINHNLKIQFSTVQSLQHNTGKSLVFLECQSEDQALAAADKNDGKHEITIENIKYAVNVYMEDGATTVRIHDISPQSENSVIEQALEQYGDIIWLKEETWTEPAILKGIKSGVRSVRIRLHSAIPSYINVRGEVTLVTYKNQQQTCRHCNKPVHWGRKCIEANYMEMQLQSGMTGNISDRLRASGVDYAGALKQVGHQTASTAGTGSINKQVSANFTNLNQLLRTEQNAHVSKSNDPVIPAPNTKNHNTNDTPNNNTDKGLQHNSGSNHRTTDVSVGDEKILTSNSALASTSKFVSESSSLGIPLNNTFTALISDDELPENDGTRSRSTSPSHKKQPKRSRSRKTSK